MDGDTGQRAVATMVGPQCATIVSNVQLIQEGLLHASRAVRKQGAWVQPESDARTGCSSSYVITDAREYRMYTTIIVEKREHLPVCRRINVMFIRDTRKQALQVDDRTVLSHI